MEKKLLTLCCVYNETHILLGEKKYGKLQGLWNGFGGKIETGETIAQAAARELEEECCVKPVDMQKRGVLTFIFESNEKNPFDMATLEVHIYSVTRFKGEPQETNEMRPQWFLHGEIPYEHMWADDPYWLPLLLSDKCFTGTFHYSDQKTITEFELHEVDGKELPV